MTARVAIVIPTWNRRALLAQAVRSVVEQTESAWELVVVDDGSTDGSAGDVERLADPRIRVLRLEHGGNVARLRNAGVFATRAPRIAFLDSDDLWLPRKLELQMAAMSGARADWCYTAFDHVGPQGEPVPARAGKWAPLSGSILPQVLTCDASPAISTLMVGRALLERVGAFDEDPGLAFREDYDLAIRLAGAAPALALDQVLTRIRVHPARSTGALDDNFQRMARVYSKFLAGGPPPGLARIARRRRALHLAEAGARLLGARHLAPAAGCLARAAADGASPRLLASALARGLRRR